MQDNLAIHTHLTVPVMVDHFAASIERPRSSLFFICFKLHPQPPTSLRLRLKRIMISPHVDSTDIISYHAKKISTKSGFPD